MKRTDTQLLDALEALPYAMKLVYNEGQPRSDSVPPLREQINRFLDMNTKPVGTKPGSK